MAMAAPAPSLHLVRQLFAKRCGNFVETSSAAIWIIGNEMNLAYERPGNNNGQGGEVITPERYASCYTKCRAEIRSRPGHSTDQVIVGAVGPYNIQTTYPGNTTGDFKKYLADILALIDQIDGVSIHAYTHGKNPGLVFSDVKMTDPRVSHLHNEFRVYRDFMAAIPQRFRNRPVYITETDQYNDWGDVNSGWIRRLPGDQHLESEQRQPAHPGLILYRWIIGNPNDPKEVGWAIQNKPNLQDDWRDAMNNNYQVVLPNDKPLYLVAWLQADVPGRIDPGTQAKFPVTVRNDGRIAWANSGASPSNSATAGSLCRRPHLDPPPAPARPGRRHRHPAPIHPSPASQTRLLHPRARPCRRHLHLVCQTGLSHQARRGHPGRPALPRRLAQRHPAHPGRHRCHHHLRRHPPQRRRPALDPNRRQPLQHLYQWLDRPERRRQQRPAHPLPGVVALQGGPPRQVNAAQPGPTSCS